ncbi:hypothetical protein TWF481_004534 [Arthrobotrys musiformis]|uniref:F-box domain-containing protein n=1 Tax=Arthrobotrys musiformis TaxID=47236 RepID=A0AAV9WJT8_9PEZI
MSGKMGSDAHTEVIVPPNPTKRMPYLPLEVVEAILLETTALTVLTSCRQVCRTWKCLIETSPKLKYYSTTGLKLNKYDLQPDIPPQVTPMAMDVLSKFWQKIAKHGFADSPKRARTAASSPFGKWITKPISAIRNTLSYCHSYIYMLGSDPGAEDYSTTAKPAAWRHYLMMTFFILTFPINLIWSLSRYYVARVIYNSPFTTINRHRSKIRKETQRLLKIFESAMIRVPFTTAVAAVAPEKSEHIDENNLYTIDISTSTNWSNITDYFGPILDQSQKPTTVPATYYNTINLLAIPVFFYIPSKINPIPVGLLSGGYNSSNYGGRVIQPTDAVVMVKFEYFKYGEEKGAERFVFRGKDPFDAMRGEEGEYLGMTHWGHYHRVKV